MISRFFSVIITTYNARSYIEKTITSVLRQDFKDYEILIVDDCSDDETIDIVKKKFFDKVKIFSTKKNFGGPAESRNIGIKNSQGKWIAFLDGDDFWFEDKLSYFNKIIISKPNYEVYCSNEILIDTKTKKEKIIKHGPFTDNFFENLLYDGNKLSPSASIVNKNFLIKKNIYFDNNEDFIGVEDYDFWLNLSKNNAKFFFISKTFSAYVIHNKNITNNSKRHLTNTINVLNKNHKYLKINDVGKYSARIFNVKYSFIINQIVRRNNNILLNFMKFFRYSLKNPILSSKFILKKLK